MGSDGGGWNSILTWQWRPRLFWRIACSYRLIAEKVLARMLEGGVTYTMSPLLLIIVLLLVFGGGGFYLGGPAIGGGGFGLILLVCIVIYFMGGFRRKA